MRKKNATSIFTSILYLVLGIIFLIYKDSVFSTMNYIIGCVLLFIGFFRIFGAIKRKNSAKKFNTVGDFTVGIIIALVGLFLILPFFDDLIAFAFGLFFIIDGVGKIITVFANANAKNKAWWVSLIVAVLVLAAGIFIIVQWTSITKYIAIFIGVMLIVSGIQGILVRLGSK